MTEILPGLYLGDVDDARNTNVIFPRQIRLILNCSNHERHYLKSARDPYRIAYHKVRVNDDLTGKSIKAMIRELQSAVDIVQDHLANQQNVLVHCHRGVQRSSCVVTGYLMKHRHMTLQEAISFVIAKRSCAFWPSINFFDALKWFETHCKPG